jgi:hypothetical protein
VRDDVRGHVTEHLGDPDAVLVVMRQGDIKKAARLAISSSRSPWDLAASARPRFLTSTLDGISQGSTSSADSPATVTFRAGSGRSPACQWTPAASGWRGSALDTGADHGGQHPVDPVALARGGSGVDDLLRVANRDVLAGDRADDRGGEPLAQAALVVPVLARPPVGHRGAGPG